MMSGCRGAQIAAEPNEVQPSPIGRVMLDRSFQPLGGLAVRGHVGKR